MSNVVEVSKEITCDKDQQFTPIKTDKKIYKMLLYQLKVRIVIILEIPVGTQMVKLVQGWDIIKRINNKRKVYVRQFSGSKADCMKDYMKP